MGNTSEADLTPEQLDAYRAEQKRGARTDIRSRVEDAQKRVLDPRVITAGATLALWALHIDLQYVIGAFVLIQGARLGQIIVKVVNR